MTSLDSIPAKSAKERHPFRIETRTASERTPIRGGAAPLGLYYSASENIQESRNINTFLDENWALVYKIISQDARRSYHRIAAFAAPQVSMLHKSHFEEILIAIKRVQMPAPAREFLRGPLEALVFLDAMYGGNRDEASSDNILTTIQTVFGWISQGELATLDAVMKFAEPQRLAPEIQLSILRASTKINEKLEEWPRFCSAVRSELEARQLDADDLLQGL